MKRLFLLAIIVLIPGGFVLAGTKDPAADSSVLLKADDAMIALWTPLLSNPNLVIRWKPVKASVSAGSGLGSRRALTNCDQGRAGNARDCHG